MKKLTLFLVAMTMSLLSFAQSQMSGTYTVGTGGSYDYSSMADAGMAIKSAEFTGDVTLLICTDLTETINTGIVNKSEYTLTIRPDKDENRTITYTTATDNTGPTGVFVIGGDMTKTPGSTIGWASVPTKNVIVDGAAEGKTTPRLKITTGKWATNFLLYGDVQDCVVKNCILVNTYGNASAHYAITFRSENYSKTSKNIGPKNCLVENCVLEATHTTKSQTVYFQGNQANSAAGYPANITIRNCNIKAHTRGMFLYGVNGLNVEGCTFDLSDMASGLMCHGILGNTVKGTINVKGNKFIKNSTKNTYAGEYGLQTITASGGATLWVIENNYFAGYNAVASGTTTKESRLVGIRCGDNCIIRHNTFHMPKLTYAPGTSLVGTHAVALLWLAGSYDYLVQNNIFVCEETTANVSLIRGGLKPDVTGNVFFHNGGNAAIVAAAPSCMTFADLETSYPTQAATSKWKNVTFTDVANGDLSLAGKSNGDLDLAVNRLAEVLTDITGKSRREQTYAGAYEGANFPSNMPSSITLTAYPVQDYSASIVGTMKRAIQNGENTIVLTHEADGTPHIYSIEHSTKTVTELSQEGVVARDPENAGDYLSISDIALTEDGKLVASNYMRCEQGTTPAEGYKVGEIRYYIWDNINTAPTRWFTTNKTANSSYADVSYTFAIKGTSTNAQLMSTAVHNNNRAARINLHTVVNGVETAYHRFGLHTSSSEYTEAKQGTNFQITATPLDNIWALEGELTDPTSFAVPATIGDPYTGTALKNTDLGKKYTGASYLNYDGHYLMVAPYANGEGKLAGVKVLGITLGFDDAISVATSTDLSNAIDATAAAATAYVDGDGDLTIYLIADAKVYAFSQKVPTKYTISARASNNSMGYVTGGGTYYAGETVTLTAYSNSTYCFTGWEDGETNNPRTITVGNTDATYVANFAQASPRAWAYDLKLGEDTENYIFNFVATTASNATLLFLDKEGNEIYAPHSIGAVSAGANSVSIAKSSFATGKDIYWSVKMDGDAISYVAEITDQTLGLYDFYSMRGVVVDNNPNSNDFGKVYLQMPVGGTSNGKERTSGLYIFDQKMNSLNNDPYKGIVPTVPSGYTFGNASNTFHRLNINPNTGNLVYSYNVSGLPAIFAIDRDNITNEVTNLLSGVSGLSTVTRTGAHCFDNEGNLYILDIYPYSNTKYPQGWYGNGIIYKIVDGVATKLVENTNWANESITLASDGRGGLWVSQNRGQMDSFYQLAHVTSEGDIDWYVNKNSTHGLDGGAARGALVYDVERQILAQGRNSRVEVFSVAYDATTGVPTLTKIATTPQVNKPNIDALAFDYAGDLYVANSGTEKLYKYTLPTADNICTVPAPKSQAIMFTPKVTVTINVVGNGTTTGAGTYDQGSTVTLKAIAQANNRFVNWTKGEEVVSTETTYSFVVTEDVTLTANFEAIPQYAITVETSNADQGSVTGGGTYYEGSTATLTATPVGGYVFEKWSDDNTDNPRTITVSEAATYTAIFKLAPARVFAYNLDVVDNGNDTYTLSFIPNTNAVSGRVILYNSDTKAQIHEESIAGAIVKGVKSEVVISRSSLPATGNVTWAVELIGEQVEKLTLLTKADDKANYGFNRPQGVAIDNNPASDFFGRIYIALPKAGGTGYSDTNYGIVVMDPQHRRLKNGVVANGDALGANGRYSMHRVAVNPTNGNVYYVRTSDSSEGVTGTAIYELAPDATNVLTDGGTAKNVINGISEITNANSVCFDETGAMYVMANANYTNEAGSTGRVYKVIDGVATLFTPNSIEIASKDNAIVPDGKGGFWVAQHRNSLDGSNHLFHINTFGVTDYYIDQNNNASLLPIQTYTKSGTTYKNASYRGQVAYYSIDENNGLVAYGGGAKVSVFKATYDGSGVPTLESWQTISLLSQSSKEGINVDGIAFDYAGNIIVMSATDERMYQYALPIESANTSLVPSPTSKTIKLGTLYNVEVAVNDNAMGTATGAGEYLEGETATVTATANTGYRFLNWTNAGVEVSTNKTYSFTVTESVTLTANFAPLPEIAYELNGGVWNQYGWTSKKDMYNALLDDWRAYSGSTRTNVAYETQLGIGNSSKGIPTTITSAEDRVALWNLFTDATYAPKWGWLATYVDAVAATQYKKMDAAQGVKTQPTSAAGVFTFTLGNFFGEDNAHTTDYIDAVDFTGAEAHPEAFQPTWGQSLPNPTQPTTNVVLGNPIRENYLFGGWYAESDFSGAAVTTVDETTDGTLYAKWVEHFYTRDVTNGEYGTICLPYASSNYSGAEFYEVSWMRSEGANAGLYLDEVAVGTTLEAGKPYIFRATDDLLTVYYEGDKVDAPIEGANGLTGTFALIEDKEMGNPSNVLEGNYLIAQNKIWLCEANCSLYPNRAYIKDSDLPKKEQSLIPGRRRVCMGSSGENTETGTENALTPNVEVIKRIENGQVIIIRDGVKYNVQGQKMQ